MNSIKRIAAIAVLMSFFLPLSQCQVFSHPSPGSPIAQQQQLKQSHENDFVHVIHLSKSFELGNPSSWLFLLAFAIPILVTVIQEKAKKSIYIMMVLLAPIFCVVSIYHIGQIIMLGKPLYGGYIWSLAMVAYTLISVKEFIQLVLQNSSKGIGLTR